MVADVVAAGVVDRLEVVEVDQESGETVEATQRDSFADPAQGFGQEGPVVAAFEGVPVGKLVKLPFPFAQLGLGERLIGHVDPAGQGRAGAGSRPDVDVGLPRDRLHLALTVGEGVGLLGPLAQIGFRVLTGERIVDDPRLKIEAV